MSRNLMNVVAFDARSGDVNGLDARPFRAKECPGGTGVNARRSRAAGLQRAALVGRTGTPGIVPTMVQSGSPEYFAGKRCFVTGAASGIGRATALRLAAHGAELYLTDRDGDGLAQTVADARALGAQVPAHRVLDISNYEQVAAFAADIHTGHSSMDVVLNIAGVSAWGTVDRLTHEQWNKMISINLMGPIHVIESFVPQMIAARRGGHVVNVSSAAGIVALPWHAAYSASKYGLRGLSEVLRFDLARHRIAVSVVVPGAVRTPLVNTVEIAGVDREDPQVARWVNRFSGHAVSPERAAEKILAGVARKRYLIYTSQDIRALYAFKRLAWWPYSVAMRQVNGIFTRALKPAPPQLGR